MAPYVMMAIVALFIWIGTRKGEMPRTLIFGILFYFFTIALVLQFISVGKAIMAERYTYIPYIGLAFILGMVTDYYLQRKAPLKYLGFGLAGATVVMVIVFSFMTHERVKVWKDDIALWSDALRQFPDGRMNFIYEKRAKLYLDKDQYEASLADYMTMNANDPRNANALECMGRIYGKYYKDLGKALECLEKVYAINPKNTAVLKSLGVAMGMKGNFQGSLEYLLQAYEIDKTDTTLLLNIAASYGYMGMPAKAKEYEQLYKSLKSR
jgi:tetratricopeptide (TPR) repeat protein